MRKPILFNISRRRFLRSMGASTSMLFLGCESMDRLILGKPPADETVFILGAGLAGLAAGIELKRRKIPFVILEAGTQPGGRVRSMASFGAAEEVLDLGGEWISSKHSTVIQWIKELRLEVIRRTPALVHRFPLDPQRDKEFARLLKGNPRPTDAEAVQVSALEWFKKISRNSDFETDLKLWSHFRYGADPDQIQAGLLPAAWRDFPSEEIKLRKGAMGLVMGLFERIAGVLPAENFLWEHRLLEVEDTERGFRLVMQADGEEITFEARRVICALPAAVLSGIRGLSEKSGLPKNASFGKLAKGGGYFAEKFWGKNFSTSGGFGLTQDFVTWESGRRQNFQKGGLLSFSVGGKLGQEAGPHSLQQWRESLLHTLRKEVSPPQQDHLQNWSQLPSFRGSHFVLAPGMNRESFFRNELGLRKWVWAGEHTSQAFLGTMEGALRSGKDGALQLLGEA